ncbi:Branched-chain amino acid transport protein AzlC [Caballeronia glathei]|uniref:Branched-chain amino acid ABC transporter permease n=1 Tax=Caballeronia glathei TaxID=60547 RepID=A0A069PGQ8_9BURK|nr:branched-chain amino acid ABC transporter permease [Caballeronia glathei]CDY79927.1 Branched-chain amino acid transport protein AzlC [Caballeronia glathei]
MLDRLSDTNRRAFLDGVHTFSPALLATLSWGLVTGIAMTKSVLSVPQALGMSLAVYAGSSQLAVLPLLAAGLPLWTILLTAAMVNLRFVIFSAGLAPHFAYLSLRRRLLLGYFNGDIIYLMFSKRNFPTGFQPGKEAFFWGLAVSSWSSWQVSSIAGILLASLFPDNWGLELAGTLALIPLIVSAIATRSTLAAVGIASIVALLAFDLPYRLGLPLAVIAALAAGTFADVIIDRRAPRTAAITGKGGRGAAARALPDDGGKPHPSGLASAQASAQAGAEAIAQANTPSQQSTPAEPVDPASDASRRDPNRPDTTRTAR